MTEHAWGARLANGGAFAAPVALIGGLALAGGGFDLAARHLTALAAWGLVILLIASGAASKAKAGWPLYGSVGLMVGLALLSAISSLWSGSAERSVIEADRVLAYLGFFFAALLIAQTEKRRQRFAEGLALATAGVALLALGSRLLPDLISISNPAEGGARLSYPLDYWNADGVMFGCALVLLLWMARRGSHALLRWVAVGALPATLLALYFTYSRGGVLAAAVGITCLLALSHDRLWSLATLAITLLCTIPAVRAIQDRRELADNVIGQTSVDQGLTVLAVLAAGTAVALLAHLCLRIAERRGGSRTARIVELSRKPRLLQVIAGAGIVIALGAAIAVGGRAWDRFSSPDIRFPDQPEQHFAEFSSAGRHDFWRVAFNTFEDHPILGDGAGSYEYAWEKGRSIDMVVVDAHSLYVEAFAELGVVGGVLTLGLIGGALWWGFGAWRGAGGAGRERSAALFAVMLAFAVTAAFDWSWEMAGLGVLFFLSAGVLTSMRCAQLASGPASPGTGEGPRYGLEVAGLALAWISALALVGPYLVQREISASQEAAADGDIPSAVSHADNAKSIEPWASSPYLQLGLLAELQGNYPAAIAGLTKAIDRDDRNWQLYYARALVEEKAGDTAAARRDLEQVKELNPLAGV